MREEGGQEMSVPAENTIRECKSCGARIFFARTAEMRDMPLDAKPVRVIQIDELGPGETQHKIRWAESFKSHFATCPKAEDWRKAK